MNIFVTVYVIKNKQLTKKIKFQYMDTKLFVYGYDAGAGAMKWPHLHLKWVQMGDGALKRIQIHWFTLCFKFNS